jgi:hypothetical protein
VVASSQLHDGRRTTCRTSRRTSCRTTCRATCRTGPYVATCDAASATARFNCVYANLPTTHFNADFRDQAAAHSHVHISCHHKHKDNKHKDNKHNDNKHNDGDGVAGPV